MNSVLEKVIGFIIEIKKGLGDDIPVISGDEKLEDYIESINFIELIIKIEEEYDIEFTDDDIMGEDIKHIKDLCGRIEALINKDVVDA